MSDNPSNMTHQRPSHSKRHASFNSPREVPLPSPTISTAESASPFFLPPDDPVATIAPPRSPAVQAALRAQDERDMNSVQSLAQEGLLRAQKRPDAPFPPPDSASDSPTPPQVSTSTRGPEATIFSALPSSLPQFHSASYSSTLTSLFYQQQDSMPVPALPQATGWLDRYSSASLPLPSQIPFHTLSKPPHRPFSPHSSFSMPQSGIDSPSPSSEAPSNPTGRCPQLNSENASSSSSSSSSSDSANSASTTISSFNAEPSADKQPDTPLSAQEYTMTREESRPAPRPISPFRAPQPPPSLPRAPSLSEGTAMRRFMTASQLQSMSMSNALSHSSMASSSSTSSMPLSLSDYSYPPPEPPTILPVDPTHDVTSSQSDLRQAPYMPFLSHVLPPPESSWIEVETAQHEYKLLVRLPGFSREGITLATKRRRILHIVADSWANGGGHFERKISFGYDADLAQVRAEFDGVMLRIAIPRRVSPITWSGNMARLGTSGRA